MQQLAIIQYGTAKEAFQLQQGTELKPQEFQVLVKVAGFGLNYADVMARNGLYKDAPKIPFVPGYEIEGQVIDRGSQVPEEIMGKRVVAFTRFGGYADLALADYRALSQIPEEMPGGEACALATQYGTAYYMTNYLGRLHKGEIALIHACAGGVGTALTQLCHLQGVRVVGLCSTSQKVDYLKKMGVEFPINYREVNYSAAIEKEFGKRKMNLIFNTVAGKSFKKDLKLLAHGGHLFCFGGAARSGQKSHLLNDLAFLMKTGFVSPLFMMMKAQGIIGVNMLRIADHRIDIIGHCLHALVSLWEKKKIRPQVGATFPATEIAAAHQLLESGESTGKVYVYW
ncbi:quinone oxidoreductase family protein [Cyclobacterium jeungdonense]|uniref:Zinc-binding dehydrogenase n=1 Tax=Cyclobacterium jeungdonense TaxID=708087 RepID=A0ABT8C749_9BACT|nr:zinc-binding dehydrogenase [Cyclobacterium jeungdonense]MDN3687555.1 zinc-binding dehydrogenase [Cyclobacterium jeungdonense]